MAFGYSGFKLRCIYINVFTCPQMYYKMYIIHIYAHACCYEYKNTCNLCASLHPCELPARTHPRSARVPLRLAPGAGGGVWRGAQPMRAVWGARCLRVRVPAGRLGRRAGAGAVRWRAAVGAPRLLCAMLGGSTAAGMKPRPPSANWAARWAERAGRRGSMAPTLLQKLFNKRGSGAAAPGGRAPGEGPAFRWAVEHEEHRGMRLRAALRVVTSKRCQGVWVTRWFLWPERLCCFLVGKQDWSIWGSCKALLLTLRSTWGIIDSLHLKECIFSIPTLLFCSVHEIIPSALYQRLTFCSFFWIHRDLHEAVSLHSVFPDKICVSSICSVLWG